MNEYEDALNKIGTELGKAVEKFPYWPSDPFVALAILGEEYGELQKAILQFVYEPGKATELDIEKEAIQTAAMCIRLVKSLGQYVYSKNPQHKQ